MLEVVNLQVAYGAAPAIWDVSINVQRGELVCVVGPNGAGKSTPVSYTHLTLPTNREV